MYRYMLVIPRTFDKGTIVGDKYENRGTILDPAKTKQDEFGVKYQNAGFLLA